MSLLTGLHCSLHGPYLTRNHMLRSIIFRLVKECEVADLIIQVGLGGIRGSIYFIVQWKLRKVFKITSACWWAWSQVHYQWNCYKTGQVEPHVLIITICKKRNAKTLKHGSVPCSLACNKIWHWRKAKQKSKRKPHCCCWKLYLHLLCNIWCSLVVWGGFQHAPWLFWNRIRPIWLTSIASFSFAELECSIDVFQNLFIGFSSGRLLGGSGKRPTMELLSGNCYSMTSRSLHVPDLIVCGSVYQFLPQRTSATRCTRGWITIHPFVHPIWPCFAHAYLYSSKNNDECIIIMLM